MRRISIALLAVALMAAACSSTSGVVATVGEAEITEADLGVLFESETLPVDESLVKDGIPFTAFEVSDLDAEVARLTEAGVSFTGEPMDFDGTRFAVFDDTCGNLIQIYQPPAT